MGRKVASRSTIVVLEIMWLVIIPTSLEGYDLRQKNANSQGDPEGFCDTLTVRV